MLDLTLADGLPVWEGADEKAPPRPQDDLQRANTSRRGPECGPKGEVVRKAITRVTADAPWKGTHDGRWWTLDADDVESAARAATKGATVRVLCALLNVSKPSHPKALKTRAVLAEAGVPWPCE